MKTAEKVIQSETIKNQTAITTVTLTKNIKNKEYFRRITSTDKSWDGVELGFSELKKAKARFKKDVAFFKGNK